MKTILEIVGFIFRKLIYLLVKLLNRLIGYRIWNKGQEPEIKERILEK